MRNIRVLLHVLTSISLFLGCASYRVGNQTFSSPSAALDRQQENLSSVLSKVSPTENPVHGRLFVVLPTVETIEKDFVFIIGHPVYVRSEQLQFTIASIENKMNFLVNAIIAKKIFDDVTRTTAEVNLQSVPIECDFLLWPDIDGWFLRGKSDPATYCVFRRDQEKASLEDNLSFFLDSLGNQARTISTPKNE